MADLRRIIGSMLAAGATGNPFAFREAELNEMLKRAQVEQGMEALRMQKEMHELEKKKFDIAIKQAEREGQGFFERLGLIPSGAPEETPATQTNVADVIHAIFTKGTPADVKDIGIPLLTATMKDSKPISVGGQGVYTPGKGFEKAPWENEGKLPQSVAGAWIQGRTRKLVEQGMEENAALMQASDEARKKGLEEKETLINIRQTQEPSAASQRHISTGLRKEFNNLGPVREYRDIENKFNVMSEAFEESKKTGNFVAVDQALVTLFNKMSDPSSVVRESEYVRTPQDMSVMSRIKASVSRIGKGGRLDPDTRQALMTMAGKFREAYARKFNDLAEEWRQYAIGYGVDPNLVVGKVAKVAQIPSQKVVVKKFVSKSTGKTKYVYSDGTEEIR